LDVLVGVGVLEMQGAWLLPIAIGRGEINRYMEVNVAASKDVIQKCHSLLNYDI